MMQTRFKEPVSGFTHLFAAILAFFGMLWLISLTHDNTLKMISVIVFGVTMILLYSASSAMHLFNGSPYIQWRLNRLDHAAIYLLIAGTYTPLCYNLLTGEWQVGLLVGIWTLAVMGAVSKLLLNWGGHISTILYVLMAWVGILGAPTFIATVDPGAIALVLMGGLVYTVGAVVYSVRRPNLHPQFGHHELWHLFVMGGNGFHFAAILIYVCLP